MKKWRLGNNVDGEILMSIIENAYFLNIDFGKKLTGIERSSLKRAHLFIKHLDILPVFVTSKFNLDLIENIDYYKKIGWFPQDCKIINVYDELCERNKSNLNRSFFYSEDDYEIRDVNKNHQRFIGRESNISLYVFWRNFDEKIVSYINFFSKGRKIRREKYDANGILYLVQLLNFNCEVESEDYLDCDENVILRKIFNTENKKIIRIEKYKNNKMERIFFSEQELIDYWLCWSKIKNDSLLVIDKNKFWSKVVSSLTHKYKVISIIHSVHVREVDVGNIISGKINYNYIDILESSQKIDAIVTLTEHQKIDLLARYHDKHRFEVIPHSLDQPAVILEKSLNLESFNIVAMCRLAPEKQLEDMVYILKEINLTHPLIKLFIYGEGAERIKIEKLVKEFGLENNVFLPGYVDDLREVYLQADLSIMTSKCEGFSLAILESLAHSIPVISYDIKYGPSSMIRDGYNGYLFQQKDYKNIANCIKNLFLDEELLLKLKKNAFETAQNYSEELISEKWKILLREIYDDS